MDPVSPSLGILHLQKRDIPPGIRCIRRVGPHQGADDVLRRGVKFVVSSSCRRVGDPLGQQVGQRKAINLRRDILVIPVLDPFDDPGFPAIIIQHDVMALLHPLLVNPVHKNLKFSIPGPPADKFQAGVSVQFPDKVELPVKKPHIYVSIHMLPSTAPSGPSA